MRWGLVLVLLPTLAFAQLSTNRGAICGVNLSCVSATFTATTTTGSGFACNSALASCIDLGPGSCNSLGTDGSGAVLVGGDACAPTVKFGSTGNVTITGNGGITLANAGLDLNNNTTMMNTASGKPILVNEESGFRLTPYSATPTCNAGAAGNFSTDSDDNRAYYCNGTAAQTIAFLGGPWSKDLDFAIFAGAGCQTLTFVATGAVLDETVAPGGCGSVSNGDADLTCEISITATDTASVRLCCIDAAGCADLGVIVFSAAALR